MSFLFFCKKHIKLQSVLKKILYLQVLTLMNINKLKKTGFKF